MYRHEVAWGFDMKPRYYAEPFTTVEVEVGSRCNRKCSYCPVSVVPPLSIPRHMSDQVFGQLLAELKRIGFAGRISYHFYNEPLLRKDLEHLVVWTVDQLPRAHPVLFTNGDLLTDARHASLRASGVEYIVVTRHSGGSYPERPFQIVQYPSDLVLTNRGGTMTNLPAATDDILHKPCFAASEMLIVSVTGDVLLCYEDARREHVMGNIMRAPLEEIWFSANFCHIRSLLELGKRSEASAICKVCTNEAHIIPGVSAHSEPFWNHMEISW